MTQAMSKSELMLEQFKQLTAEQQQSVLDFLETLQKKHQPSQSILDKITSRFADLPPEILDELPSDASENLDYYLYGVPKK